MLPKFVKLHQRTFPSNVLDFRSYGGMKVLALLLFLWTSGSFLCTLYEVAFDRDKFKKDVAVEIENRGIIKKGYYWAKGFLWQATPKQQQIEQDTKADITNAILWGLLKLAITWCILWLCFDWRNARNLVFAAFSISVGIAYSFLPINAIPNFIPAIGSIDDICANLFGSGIGIASIAEYIKKRRQQELVNSLIEKNPQAALAMVLEEYGITIKKD